MTSGASRSEKFARNASVSRCSIRARSRDRSAASRSRNFDAQPLVGLLQRGGALLDPRLELALRARSACSLWRSVRSAATRSVTSIACPSTYGVRPDRCDNTLRYSQSWCPCDAPTLIKPASCPCSWMRRRYSSNRSRVSAREKLAQVLADTVFRPIAERAGRGGIDGEDGAGQVVRADQAEAVFDQLPVSLFAVAERVAGFAPRRGHGFERGNVVRPARPAVACRLSAATLLHHWPDRDPTESGDYINRSSARFTNIGTGDTAESARLFSVAPDRSSPDRERWNRVAFAVTNVLEGA